MQCFKMKEAHCPHSVLIKLQSSSPQTDFDTVHSKIVWKKLGKKQSFEQEIKHWAAAAAQYRSWVLLSEISPWPQAGHPCGCGFPLFLLESIRTDFLVYIKTKVLALQATVSCTEAKQDCISPWVILVFCYPDALEHYWCVENYEVRKILISFKENWFCRKGIFWEQLNRSVLQGRGAEQESGEGAVPCPALMCWVSLNYQLPASCKKW